MSMAITGGMIGGMAGAQMGSTMGPLPREAAITILVMIVISIAAGYAKYRHENKYCSACLVIDFGGWAALCFAAQVLLIGIFFLIKIALGF